MRNFTSIGTSIGTSVGTSMGLLAALVLATPACVTDDGSDPAEEPDPALDPDPAPIGIPQPIPNPDPTPNPLTCALAATIADTGSLTALKANQCQVPGSMGARKWYRLTATLPGTTNDLVQIELWDGRGPFTGGVVTAGTYPISGANLDPATCGVCVRALGDKGTSTVKEYFATGGTVVVSAVGGNGATLAATLTGGTFVEIDPVTKAPVSGGCASSMTRVAASGTVVAMGGGGGGGGNCPQTIGD
jgi:hypothetical protein